MGSVGRVRKASVDDGDGKVEFKRGWTWITWMDFGLTGNYGYVCLSLSSSKSAVWRLWLGERAPNFYN